MNDKLNSTWIEFDPAMPPAPGTYLIWDPCLRDPREPRIWTYRNLRRWDKWKKPKRDEMSWFSDGNWPSDRAPKYYMPLPLLPSPGAQGGG